VGGALGVPQSSEYNVTVRVSGTNPPTKLSLSENSAAQQGLCAHSVTKFSVPRRAVGIGAIGVWREAGTVLSTTHARARPQP
jgi:hypothetical protein